MEDVELTPNQLLTLWRLAVVGGEEWLKQIKSKPNKAEREELAECGLAETVSEPHPETGRAGMKLRLTEEGWSAIRKSFPPSDLAGNARAGEVLEELLKLLRRRLSDYDLTLMQLIQPGLEKPKEITTPLPTQPAKPAAAPVKRLGSAGEYREEPAQPQEREVPAFLADAAVLRSCQELAPGKLKEVALPELRKFVNLMPYDFSGALERMVERGEIKIEPVETEIGNLESEEGAVVALVEAPVESET
ncbi:MAG: hypothetical protein CMO55_25520 [Verrucomicrobiales bacterium]|nr:hypothetical protein [Verrucomicrobiales bacterium]